MCKRERRERERERERERGAVCEKKETDRTVILKCKADPYQGKRLYRP